MKAYMQVCLKGRCHEISISVDFFQQSTPYGLLIHHQKNSQFWGAKFKVGLVARYCSDKSKLWFKLVEFSDKDVTGLD
jgi:hypothetical protein